VFKRVWIGIGIRIMQSSPKVGSKAWLGPDGRPSFLRFMPTHHVLGIATVPLGIKYPPYARRSDVWYIWSIIGRVEARAPNYAINLRMCTLLQVS